MAVLKAGKLCNCTVAALSVGRDTVFSNRELTGFGVRAYPSGGRVFVREAQGPENLHKPRRITAGRHPVPNAWQARQGAALIIARVETGNEPVPLPLPAKMPAARPWPTSPNAISRSAVPSIHHSRLRFFSFRSFPFHSCMARLHSCMARLHSCMARLHSCMAWLHSCMAWTAMTARDRNFTPSRSFCAPGSGWPFEGWKAAGQHDEARDGHLRRFPGGPEAMAGGEGTECPDVLPGGINASRSLLPGGGDSAVTPPAQATANRAPEADTTRHCVQSPAQGGRSKLRCLRFRQPDTRFLRQARQKLGRRSKTQPADAAKPILLATEFPGRRTPRQFPAVPGRTLPSPPKSDACPTKSHGINRGLRACAR